MKTIVILLLVFSNLIIIAQPPSKSQISRLDSLFTSWDKTNSPGCILGVIKDGKFIYQRGYGMANLEHGIAISPYTVFDIGSTSKQFTAAAIILLQQQGKLSLDDVVQKYIPELPNYGKPITIRQLLNHTSGLRDYNVLLVLSGKQEEQVTTKKDALDIIIKQKALNFNPGEDWDYSNTGFFLASVIVERISGQTMKAFAEQNIFGPLGMKNTFFLDNHTTIVPYRATGYATSETGDFEIYMSNWEQTGDGAVQTNSNDLLLWDKNFYDPKVGGPDLLKHLTTTGALNNGDKLNYALGLFKEDFQGLEIVHHNGAWAGYRAEMIRFPQENISVVCLSNLASFNPSVLSREVAKIFLFDKFKTNLESKNAIAPVKALDQALLQSYIGSFRSEFNDLLRQISEENGTLYYIRNPSNKSELIYQGNDEFRMRENGTIVKFIRDGNNIVSAMDVFNGGVRPTHLIRYTPLKFERAALSGISGNYFSEELNVTWKLDLGDSEHLTLTSVSNQESFSLTQITRDSFADVSQRVSIKLTRDNRRKVNGFYFTMSRLRKINFKQK